MARQGSNEGDRMFIRDVCGVKSNVFVFPVVTISERPRQQFTQNEVVQKGLEVHSRNPWTRKLLELRYRLDKNDDVEDPLTPFRPKPLEEIRGIDGYERVSSQHIKLSLIHI